MAGVVPSLKYKEEFRKLLETYRPDAGAKQLLAGLNFVALSSIAAGGRNTVINYLVGQGDYRYIISDTTRPPKVRDGRLEENGVQYWFRSEEEVLTDVKAGRYLEAELIHDQQISGISLRELEAARDAGCTAVTDMEYGGANNIARTNPHAHIIGLLPPDFGEWKRRLESRETMSAEEYANRMRTAEKVLANMLAQPRFHIVLNDSIKEAAADIRAVVAGTYPAEKEKRASRVVKEMLAAVKREVSRL